jgi:hypothetical protein
MRSGLAERQQGVCGARRQRKRHMHGKGPTQGVGGQRTHGAHPEH